MDEIRLFIDGSVNTQSGIGFGACLVVKEGNINWEMLKEKVKVKRFENTTSTRLELLVLLWALNEIQISGKKLTVYTDSQNIVGLPGRRGRFEQNDYRSKNNRRIGNFELYREFYETTDRFDCRFVKVEGHRRADQKDETDRLFTLVDRASRKMSRASKETGLNI